MVNSMTGFGTSQYRAEGVEVEVTVKSLNGRFLDTRFHLPKEYMSLESELKQVIAKSLARGTVDVFIARRLGQSSERLRVSVNKSAVKKWQSAYQDLARLVGHKQPVSAETLAALPEVMVLQSDTAVTSAERKHLHGLIGKAVEACAKERAREGKALEKCLSGYFSDLGKLLEKMEVHIESANQELYKKFSSRLERNGLSEKVDSQRLAQEVAVYLDRCDVSEEIQRLREHLRNCKDLLGAKNSEGKKLDFYSQELLREVNTIGSKSQIATLTELVVHAKAVIEKIKEQVQNVE